MIYNGTSGPDTKNGTINNDTLNGNGGADTLDGRGGDDVIRGGDGNDQVFDSGGGNDSISGGAGNDLVYDQAGGNDTLDGGTGNDFVSGNLGDKLIGGTGTDSFYLNMGASTQGIFANLTGQSTGTLSLGQGTTLNGFESGALYLGTGADLIIVGDLASIGVHGGGGGDWLIGGALNDLLEGDAGNDTLTGGAGLDSLFGGLGQDLLNGGVGDKLYGGGDFDSFTLDLTSSAAAIDVNLNNLGAGEVDFGSGTLLSQFDRGTISMGAGADKLFQQFLGVDTTMWGGGGADTLQGDGVGSEIYGEAGDDVLHGAQSEVLDGGSGTDSFYLSLADNTAGLTMTLNDLSSGAVSIGGTLLGYVESGGITLGTGADNITLGDARIRLQGFFGADTLTGGLLDDYLEGGPGADSLIGAGGADFLDGGDGDDRLFAGVGDEARGGEGVDFLALDLGSLTGNIDSVLGPFAEVEMDGTTVALFQEIEKGEFWLGSGADMFHSYDLQTTVHGGVGNDFLAGDSVLTLKFYGDNGDDRLRGGSDSDLLSGGAGLDTITGGGGGDTLYGAGGSDTYVFLAKTDSPNGKPDLIQGLQNSDVIDLSAIDANANVAGDGAFTVVAAFSNTRGELVRSFDIGTGRTSFLCDINGDGLADFTITTDANNAGYNNFVL